MLAALRAWVKTWLPKSLHPDQIIARWIEQKTNGRVFTGPFTGMRYVDKAVGSKYFPKILGKYEKELAPLIETLLQKEFDVKHRRR